VNQKLEHLWELAYYRPQLFSVEKRVKGQMKELSYGERKTIEAISQVLGVNIYVRTWKDGELVTINHG